MLSNYVHAGAGFRSMFICKFAQGFRECLGDARQRFQARCQKVNVHPCVWHERPRLNSGPSTAADHEFIDDADAGSGLDQGAGHGR